MSHTEQEDFEDDEEFQRLVANLANICIVSNCSKVPLKRVDLGKMIPKQYSRKADLLIKLTSNQLEMIFGYKIVTLPSKQTYLLLNKLDDTSDIELSNLSRTGISSENDTVALFRSCILVVIFMSGGVILEGTLKEFMASLGVDIGSKRAHPCLGDVHKLIYTSLVRQCYLHITEHKEIENCPKEFRWGSRAEEEVDKRALLCLVSKVYGDCQPEMWTEQMKRLKV